MNKSSGKDVDILTPRKNKSLVSILKNYATFQTDGLALMNEDNEGLRTKDGRKRFMSKRKEKGFLKALPMNQFYIPGKSSTMKDMEVESKAETSSANLTPDVMGMSIADESYKVNVVARDLHAESSVVPIEDFDSTMSSCGALEPESSNLGSSCPEMSYLSNMAMAAKSSRESRRDLSECGKNINIFIQSEVTLSRKRRIRPIYTTDASEPSSMNSSMESCPSVAKKVKFFPIITSTPTKQRVYSGAHRIGGAKKLLEYSGSYTESLEQNKLEQNVGDSRTTLLSDDGNILSRSFDKSEKSLALTNSGDDLLGMDRRSSDDDLTHKNQSLSNLVEKFSSKIRFTMNNSGNGQKRKAESIDSCTEPPIYNAEDWSMGSGKYDAKYPAECMTLSSNIIRSNVIAPELPPQLSQQYKPLKQSFDDSYKLAPIQESLRKVEECQSKECLPAYAVGRHRCIGFDSKLKPKTRLRRRYKSESDLFERSIIADGKQAVNQTSDAAQESEEYEDGDFGDLISSDTSVVDGANIKLYSLTDPERSLSFNSESVNKLAVGQESVMEIFCEQMHDLQMDNT